MPETGERREQVIQDPGPDFGAAIKHLGRAAAKIFETVRQFGEQALMDALRTCPPDSRRALLREVFQLCEVRGQLGAELVERGLSGLQPQIPAGEARNLPLLYRLLPRRCRGPHRVLGLIRPGGQRAQRSYQGPQLGSVIRQRLRDRAVRLPGLAELVRHATDGMAERGGRLAGPACQVLRRAQRLELVLRLCNVVPDSAEACGQAGHVIGIGHVHSDAEHFE